MTASTQSDPLSRPYDVHIIGSGIGALTAALLLARVFKKRVCLLEQHWQPGGQTQTFRRKQGYEWDVGLHYVGNMDHPRALPARITRFITDNQLRWRDLDASFDRVRFADATLDISADEAQFIASLKQQFPAEEPAIRRYLTDRRLADKWLSREFLTQLLPDIATPLIRLWNVRGRRLAEQTLAHYLDQRFRSQSLKNLLAARYGDYGLPPQQSSFAVHAMVMESYRKGASYPEGGSRSIADVCLSQLRSLGGECVTNVSVERIVTEGKRVTALQVTEHYHTPQARQRTLQVQKVLSGAGAYNTYRKLLSPALYPELEQLPQQASATTLYLGLNRDPAELGFTSSNYWLYPRSADGELICQQDQGLFLSFPSLKRGDSCHHCAEVITIMSPDRFRQWSDSRWKKRDKDYRALKQQLTEQLTEQLCAIHPQLREAIEYRELSTPLSMAFFTRHPGGNMYGVPFVPGRQRFPFCQAKTPFSNLFLCGQDVISLGVMGALMGGAFSAAVSEGRKGFPAILKAMNEAEQSTDALKQSQLT